MRPTRPMGLASHGGPAQPVRRALCVALGLGLCLGLGAAAGVGAGGGPWRPSPALQWDERRRRGFGTDLRLLAAHEDAAVLRTALDAAEALLARLEAQMSLFDPTSALSRLNATGRLDDAPAELLAVLRAARAVSERSGGAFDITVQPLWTLWQRCTDEGRRPMEGELAMARALVGWRGVRIADRDRGGDRGGGRGGTEPTAVALARPGMGLTLNGIAPGFAADAVRSLLQSHGIRHALLDTGEWASLGRAPGGEPWRLGVEDATGATGASEGAGAAVPGVLLTSLRLEGRAVATSSGAHTRFDAEDHHVFDPRTGRSPRHLASVTVVADSATQADALSKVLFMGTPAQALQAARRWGVDALVVDRQGARWATPGLRT